MRLDASLTVGATRLGRMFERSRYWGAGQLRGWWDEQQRGGPVRVFRKTCGYLYTTIAIVDQAMPRGRRDEALERRLRAFERDLTDAYTRIAQLERMMGKRR